MNKYTFHANIRYKTIHISTDFILQWKRNYSDTEKQCECEQKRNLCYATKKFLKYI